MTNNGTNQNTKDKAGINLGMFFGQSGGELMINYDTAHLADVCVEVYR